MVVHCCAQTCCSSSNSGRGKCETATGTCVCEQGYTGDGCEASVCGHECSENSVCNVVTKVCECASGVHDAVGCDASNNANGAPSKVSFKGKLMFLCYETLILFWTMIVFF